MKRTSGSLVVGALLGLSAFVPLSLGSADAATSVITHRSAPPAHGATSPIRTRPAGGATPLIRPHPAPPVSTARVDVPQVQRAPSTPAQVHPRVTLPADVDRLVNNALAALPPDRRAATLAQLRALPPAQLAREAQATAEIVRSLPPNDRQHFVNNLFGVSSAGASLSNVAGNPAAPYIAAIEQANRAEMAAVIDYAKKNPGAFSSLSSTQAQQIGKTIAGGIDPATHIRGNRAISAPLLRGAYDNVWPCPYGVTPCYWP
jgi:hypothetical protein